MAPIRTREQWEEIHATAVATGSLKAAATAHDVPYDAVCQRARRYQWLAGSPAKVLEARHARGLVSMSATVSPDIRGSADTLDGLIHEQGRQTRAMLAQALVHGAGQARRTKHPLAKARLIKDLTSAAAQVHPDQFGGAGAQQVVVPIQINLGSEG
jgi:hypothetical protein